MKIHCKNLTHLLACVADLVSRGVGFEADTDTLTIELTGAH